MVDCKIKIASKSTLLNKNKVTVNKDDLADLERRTSFSDNYNDLHTKAKHEATSLGDKLTRKTWDYDDLERENVRLRNLVNTLQNLIKQVDIFLQRKMGIHLPDKFLERAGLKEPSHKVSNNRTNDTKGPHL